MFISHIPDTLEVKVKVLVTQSCLTLCDPMDCVVHQAPLSMGFPRQEYWSGLPSPSHLPYAGIRPGPPALEAWSLSHWATREESSILFKSNRELAHVSSNY